MRVIIAGGREYTLTSEDRDCLDRLHTEHCFTAVLSGRARGADTGGAKWAATHAIPVEGYPADWVEYGRGAGMIRNGQMVKAADALVAFPGGRGTADVVRRAVKAGLRVWIVHPC